MGLTGNGLVHAAVLSEYEQISPLLLFLLMTLGPTLVLLAIFERRQARHDLLSRLLIVFGRVPLFFYLLHLYVIHGLVIVFAIAMNRDIEPFLASFDAFPSWWGFGLPAVYLLWIAVTCCSTRFAAGSLLSRRA